MPLHRTLSSVHSRAGSEPESLAHEFTESVDSLARNPAFAHALTLTGQQPIHATPFSQDEILSIDLPSSQYRIGNGSYGQGDVPSSDSRERVTSAIVGHSNFPFDEVDENFTAENDYMGQSDYLRAPLHVEDMGWDEDQHSDREDMYQQPAGIPPLYPIIYGRLGFPIVDRPFEYRLRLSGDRSGVGWPLKRWRGDETDLLADETIDIGVAPDLDGLIPSELWEETTAKSRGPYSRRPSTPDRSSPPYRFNARREPNTTVATTIRSPDWAFEEECVQEENVVPLVYQLLDDDGGIPCGDVREGNVEAIRYSPQSKGITLNYQEPCQIIEAYPVHRSEVVFDYLQEQTEAVITPGGTAMVDGAIETEQIIQEDENSSQPQIQQPVRGFVLAPDLFGD